MSEKFLGRIHKDLATHWANTDIGWQNTVLMAARIMRIEGFGIATGQPIDGHGDLIDDHNRIAIHIETQHDKTSFEKLIQSDEFKLLPPAPRVGIGNGHIDWALKTEDQIRQIIRDKQLEPRKPGFISHLRTLIKL